MYYRNISTKNVQQGSNILNVIEFLCMSAAICTYIDGKLHFSSSNMTAECHSYFAVQKSRGQLWMTL
jgi:hypothetical protein